MAILVRDMGIEWRVSEIVRSAQKRVHIHLGGQTTCYPDATVPMDPLEHRDHLSRVLLTLELPPPYIFGIGGGDWCHGTIKALFAP